MYKVKEIFKRFFTPSGLKNFRYMNILIAILIFIFDAYLLFISVSEGINRHPEIYTSKNVYTSVFYNVSGEIDEEMKNKHYYIADGEMKSTVDDDNINVYKYNNDGNNDSNYNNVYFIFDINLKVSSNTSEIVNAYKSKYESEDENKISCVSLLIYVDMQNDMTLDEGIEKYHNMTKDEVYNLFTNIHYNDIYHLNDDSAYVMLFEKDTMYIEFPYNGVYFSNSLNYKDCADLNNFNIDNMIDIGTFSKIFTLEFGKVYAKNYGTAYLGNALIYALIFPFVVCLIVYFGLRKKGCLKQFREYYSILSILSIPPVIISFCLGWFIYDKAGTIYLTLFVVYALIMIYKISYIPDIKN